MAKYILEKIRVEGAMNDLLAVTNGENVTVVYNGTEQTLTAALGTILTDIGNLPTGGDVDGKISAAIGELVNGAPETGDTLKELFDLIDNNSDAMDTLNQAIGNKLDAATFNTFKGTIAKLGALAGKDKVAEADLDTALAENVNAAAQGNHSHANKAVLDGIDATKVTAWDGAVTAKHSHTNKTELDTIASGDVAKWNGIRGVRYGASAPADMQDGELFIRVVQ